MKGRESSDESEESVARISSLLRTSTHSPGRNPSALAFTDVIYTRTLPRVPESSAPRPQQLATLNVHRTRDNDRTAVLWNTPSRQTPSHAPPPAVTPPQPHR